MEALRLQLLEELSGELQGELLVDEVSCALYATDASLHQEMPVGVVYPENSQDVARIVRYAFEQRIPLIPRGAGTGLAGGAIGAGLIIDFSRHMNQVLEITESTVRVQPGIVLDHLNEILKQHGRYFAPDPAKSALTTIGGMAGVDAAGSHAIRVGSFRDYVRSLNVVLPDAEGTELTLTKMNFRPQPTEEWESGKTDQADSTKLYHLGRSLTRLLQTNHHLIESYQPSLPRNVAGYRVNDLLSAAEVLDLPRLFIGAEGTLGLICELELETLKLPSARSAVLLNTNSLQQAIAAIDPILNLQPAACDLLDRRLLSMARDAVPQFREMIDASSEAALLIEWHDENEELCRQRMEKAVQSLSESFPGIQVGGKAVNSQEVESFWQLPRVVAPLLASIEGRSKPVPIIEDIAVEPRRLSDFLTQVQRVFQRHEVTASLYAHAGSGQIHLRPFLGNHHFEQAQKIEDLARDLYRIVIQFKGTISGEHGDGYSRTSFLRTQYGPLYRVFQAIKSLFDPLALLNPGKIISDDPHATIRHLRPLPVIPEQQALNLTWSNEQWSQSASSCNGCGTCRSQDTALRMCPFYTIDPTEQSSPRAKANLSRWITLQDEQQEKMLSEESIDVMTRCFNCKQCLVDCPSQVDIPHLAMEVRAAEVEAQGLQHADWVLSRIDRWSRTAVRFPWLFNFLLNHRYSRKALEYLTGIRSDLKLPRYDSGVFLQNAPKQLVTSQPQVIETQDRRFKVALFLDQYANYHNHELIKDFIALLESLSIVVEIPEDQQSSGMSFVSVGDLKQAKEQAQQNLRVLGPYAREGYEIVCIEPAAVLAIRDEYPQLVNHADASVVSRRVIEAGAFLWKLYENHVLPDPEPIEELFVAYHTPCHTRYLSGESNYLKLMAKIPGLNVAHIKSGCSGMAGLYGLNQANKDNADRIAEPLNQALKSQPVPVSAAECTSCRIRLKQNSPVSLHPLKLVLQAWLKSASSTPETTEK